jgi:hypothetical protein
VTLLLVHAAVTCFLAGVGWVVQVVTYPGFRVVGPTEAWPTFHSEHSRRITRVVAVPWAVQGVCVGLLLLRRQAPSLLLPTAALAATTVVVTVVSAVPAHDRLQRYGEDDASRLLRANAVRTWAWTLGAVLSLCLVGT